MGVFGWALDPGKFITICSILQLIWLLIFFLRFYRIFIFCWIGRRGNFNFEIHHLFKKFTTLQKLIKPRLLKLNFLQKKKKKNFVHASKKKNRKGEIYVFCGLSLDCNGKVVVSLFFCANCEN
jgi:hypothetical protein